MTSIADPTQADSSDMTITSDDSAAGGAAGVATQVRSFLVDSFLLGDDDGFASDESLLDAGIVDSTGVMEVVTFLEETFSIAIDDDELVADNLDSVDRLAAFVQRKRN
jgi:acyl carrier protein